MSDIAQSLEPWMVYFFLSFILVFILFIVGYWTVYFKFFKKEK
ncbi:hypothetical protein [Pseudobdellovibrio sp. HCB154]